MQHSVVHGGTEWWCLTVNVYIFNFSYYGISDKWVDWTSMIYMILYIPLIFPGSWFLDKVVSGGGSGGAH